MIALYKLNEVGDQIDSLFRGRGYEVCRFYSVKSLVDQIMNPIVILTTSSCITEVESLPVPVLPITIHVDDIGKTIVEQKLVKHGEDPYWVIASDDEVDWLKWEYEKAALDLPLCFVSKQQFLSDDLRKGQVLLAPVWEKELSANPHNAIHYVSPSITSLMSVFQLTANLIKFTGQIAKERYQMEAIVNSAHDGVIAVDREERITVVNEHAKTILGLQGEVKGRKITEFIPHSDMLRILETGKVEMGDIATAMDRQIVINRFPVMVMDRVVGAVSTIKEINDIQKLEMKLRKLLHQNGLEAKYRLGDIVGESPEIIEAKEQAAGFAKTDLTVLITGESGTGKELLAQGIHLASERAKGPFVAVNCAALPASLLESELFGYVEGAFTGARKGGKAGLIELAHGGTLFLDEIGEIPMQIQTILLRVLQERIVRRVGGERVIPVDVRIIAATNRDLEEEIEHKQFRGDLYYRLNVLSLELPPLRERLEDIPMLVESLVHQFNEMREKKITTVDAELYQLLMSHDWPGNIRELRNVVERLVALGQGTTLSLEDAKFFSKKLKGKQSSQKTTTLSLKEREREVIASALNQYPNNKTLAAKTLGIDRSTLWRKMKEYNLEC